MDTHVHSVKGSLRSAVRYLTALGVSDPRVDAEILLAHVMGMPREKLITSAQEPLPQDERLKFNRLIARRGEKREPVAYIVGSAGFYGLDFDVNTDVLIPRPATETLVGLALKRIPAGSRFADIGTGSGAIAITILANSKGTKAVATDIDERALSVARRNAATHGLVDRILFRQGDLLQPLGRSRLDFILSNPPYVASGEFEKLDPELSHEPRSALAAGSDGLLFIRKILVDAPHNLSPRGRLMLEIGAGQADRVKELALRSGFTGVEFHDDLEGIPRVMEAWR